MNPNGQERVRLARAYLLRVAEPPAVAVCHFVEQHGPVVAAELVRDGDVPAAVAKETSARRHLELAEADLELAVGAGARLVTPEDDEWPSWRFVALDLAARRGVRYAGQPLGLWARGLPLTTLGSHSVAIVGARAATGYGEHVATDFAYGLAMEGVGVVSGAAYGIDGAAHKGAMAANGATVAVLAGGVDVAYPAGHSALLEAIAERGCVVSEYAPGSAPARHRFLVRNRLIAALGDATLVVEAGRRSGARNTAATARALGRELLAVPGPVTSAMSLGCHEMLRSGDAMAVSTVAEIVESVGRFGADLAPLGSSEPALSQLDPVNQRVYEALGVRKGRTPEQIAVDSGVALPQVRAILPALEIAGMAAAEDTGWSRRWPTRCGGA
jgi:DNA processing protein